MDKYKEFPSLRIYDRLDVPYVLTGERWAGPLWTGHCMMLSTRDGYGDEGFLHELAHWVEASPTQRRMPDFALGKQVNANNEVFATSTSPHINNPNDRRRRRADRNVGWGEPTVSLSTATAQEERACLVMYLYHALVGNTTWSEPLMAEAAYDFAGCEPFKPHAVVSRTRKIVAAMTDGKVPSETVRSYCDGLAELDAEYTFR